mgnify:CR=1 FL=1
MTEIIAELAGIHTALKVIAVALSASVVLGFVTWIWDGTRRE